MTKTAQTIALVIFAIFTLSSMAFAGWPIPDSGQTKCYNDTSEIPCPAPGEDFYGQDAQYVNNPRSYTKLQGGIMVQDNVTGLIWEVKQAKDDAEDFSNPHDADNEYTWYDSNPATNGGNAGTPGDGTDTEDFINALNSENFGGHSDWRLPTIKELASIADLGTYGPTINTEYFPNTHSSSYWSATTYAGSTYDAWCVPFSYGYDYNSPKSYSRYVRGVRSEQ